MSLPPASSVTNAGPPFNKTTADAILRASDSVDFWVRRSILAEASCVFEDMLGIPQPPPGSATSDEVKDGLPVIQLSENSTTLDKLLRLCYPTDDPPFDSLDDLRPVLQAAMKYMMQESTSLLRRRLVKLGQAQPLRAFAIACSLELVWEAEALAPLAHNVHGTFVEELGEISAGVYYRVVHYQSRTERKGSKHMPLKPRGTSTGAHAPPAALPSLHASSRSNEASASFSHIPPELLGSPSADVIVRTSDNVDLHLHGIVLSIASPILRDLIHGHHDHNSGRTYVEPLELSEDSRTLTILLRHIYPLPRPNIPRTLNELKPLLSAAAKYGIASATEAFRCHLPSFLPVSGDSGDKCERTEKDALRVFAIAHQYGFSKERRAAARALLYIPGQELRSHYVEELEDISAEVYFRLLEYHNKCGQAASAWILAHALSYSTACNSSAPSFPTIVSPQNRTLSPNRANSWYLPVGGDKKKRISKNDSHLSSPPFTLSAFPGVWPPEANAGPSDPRSILATSLGHTYTCHVMLDDTTFPAWAYFRDHSTPQWWILYLYNVAIILRNRPWARVVLDAGLRQRAIVRALECECCRDVFLAGFQEYVVRLVQGIESAVAKVKLEIL